jgi:hypothetical protein
VKVVENRAPTPAELDAWVLDAQPFLSVTTGRDGPDYEFARVVSVIRLSDGSLVVADQGSRTVRWYDAAGTHLFSAGGEGGGPGEFRSISWLGALGGDSVYTWDSQAGRLSVFFAGAFVRDYRPELPTVGFSFSVRAGLADGQLAVVPFAVPTGEPRIGIQRPPLPLLIISPAGQIEHEVGVFPSSAVEYRPAATPGAVIRGLLPFGPTTLVSSGGNSVIVGDNAAYDLRMYSHNGVLTQIIRVEGSPTRVSAEDLAMELERRLGNAPPIAEIRDGIRASFEATPVPEMKPFFDRLLVDSQDNVWVRRESGSATMGAKWDVIAADGRMLGSLRAPLNLEITQIGRDFVLGIWTDEDGAEDIRAFRLTRDSSERTATASPNS